MKFTKFNNNWKFWEVTNSFALNWGAPQDARIIDLPHDAMIEIPIREDAPAGTNTGFRKGGFYSYEKSFFADSADKTYILKVDGAYMNAFVYVNGQLAGKRPFGYTVFYVILNEYLEYGCENEIRIQVRAGAEPNSRWYPGNGLYRDVYLLEAAKTFIIPDSVKVKTVQASDEEALITVSSLIAGAKQAITVEVNILDKCGEIIANGAELINDEGMIQNCTPVNRIAGDSPVKSSDISISIAHPELWDADNPNLYSVEVILKSDEGNIIDSHTDSFGIRTMELSTSEGLIINGKEVKLRGTCIHHDSGILGAKTYAEIQIRQIRKLKESGYNAIRSSHNPAAPELLNACDKIGMYVMDECFDVWTKNKTDYDYSLYFDEWWEADVESMVNNSYNHPSVIMYSVGNEIPEIGSKIGEKITRNICDKIKSMDDTRFTTASVNGIFSVGDAIGKIVMDTAADLQTKGEFEGNVNDFMAFMNEYMQDMVCHPIVDQVLSVPFSITDIGGYNYMGGRYDLDSEIHPERIIVGSEDGVASAYSDWKSVMRHKRHIGEFTWTGWDYLGESGIGYPKYGNDTDVFSSKFPVQTGCTGDIDITGFRRPMSYYREIIFGLRKDPYIAVKDPAHYGEKLIPNPWIISDAVSSWTWSDYEGKNVEIEVYSAGDEIELFKNGQSLGKKAVNDENESIVLYETTYEPGELTAVSYLDREEIGRFTLMSAGPEVKLNVIEEQDIEQTDSDRNIRVFDVVLEDAKGNVVQDKDTEVSLKIEGAELLGFGSGDTKQLKNFTDTVTETYYGRALFIIKVKPGDNAVISLETKYGNTELEL